MAENNFDIGMYIIDKDYKILYKNQTTTEMYPEVQVGDICYKVLACKDSPCETCPIWNKDSMFYNPLRKEWISARAAQMSLPEYGECYNIQFELKQRLNAGTKEYVQQEGLTEHIQELRNFSGSECVIGGYCEEGFPLFHVNDRMIEMLGYDDVDDLIAGIDGLVINMIHPDDRKQVQYDLGDSYYVGMTYETVFRMPRKDGTWFWTVDKGKVVEAEDGRLAIISICVDMSVFVKHNKDLYTLSEGLLRKEQLTTTMMNNMPSGYHRCAAKAGCPFLFISEQFEKIVGWTREEIERDFDNLFQNLICPEDLASMKTYDDMVQMQGKGNSYSTDIYRMKKKGGGYRWVLDSAMFVDMGEESFFQATIADITDFVETQNRQKKELEDAMVRVEDANNAKTQFLSSMSHDIRTPMNAIIGMTTLAMRHLEEPEYMKNCLNKMALASNHLLTLVNDVLDISKVESGKMSLNPIVFSLVDSVTNLINIVRQQISAKSHKFDVRVHNIKKEYIFADELRLNQIFINILINAVKYTPSDGTICVDLIEEFPEDKPDTVRIIYIVEDNGIGMSKEFQENMYHSFMRANNENYGKIQGTGLGLTISKMMIDLMNGEIECESELGKGTKFTVTIDVPVAEKIGEDLMLPPMEVLLVDDDEVFLETATDTLMQIGISADCVTSGEEAIKAVVERKENGNDYPVIIVDWVMPQMDGLATVRALRELVGEEISIIVVSAYDWSDIETEAREAGVNGFISKPFFPSSVYENMVEILGLEVERKEEKEDAIDSLAGMHVLIVEDNELNWEIAKELLELYDIKVTRAEDGVECVELLQKVSDGTYDMILMDIQMPRLNGYETTTVLRKSDREYIRNIPIIAMTADAFSEDIQRCMEVGMNAHISKPINIRNLLRIIESEKKK